MIQVIIKDNIIFNVDNDSDCSRLVSEGASVLTEKEKDEAGITGFEQYVSPETAYINNNGEIVFTPPPEPTQEEIAEQIQQEFTNAIQSYLDTKAQELNYDSCLSVCSYVDTGVAKFDAEGKAFRAWRSAVWTKGYEILDKVLAGKRKLPTKEELISELPELIIDYVE